MKMANLGLLLLSFLAVNTAFLPALAKGISTYDQLELCKDEQNLENKEFDKYPTNDSLIRAGNNAVECMGYIRGFADALGVSYGRRLSHLICLPKEGSTGQLVNIFVKYANENPQILHEPAGFVLYEALFAAFPCTKD